MRDLSASFMLHTEPSPTWRDQTRRSHGLPVGLTTASPTEPQAGARRCRVKGRVKGRWGMRPHRTARPASCWALELLPGRPAGTALWLRRDQLAQDSPSTDGAAAPPATPHTGRGPRMLPPWPPGCCARFPGKVVRVCAHVCTRVSTCTGGGGCYNAGLGTHSRKGSPAQAWMT